MEILTSYDLIIASSIIIILSYFFGEISQKTNVPSVLLLILLGIGIKFGLDALGGRQIDFFPILEVLGIVGLIMIVLEAALDLELKRDKIVPIVKALSIALIGLLASTWVAALILHQFIPEMSMRTAWLYATPLSILSSAIIIPSVSGLKEQKKEFHIYESTFSDILGIMLFYFLAGQLDAAETSNGLFGLCWQYHPHPGAFCGGQLCHPLGFPEYSQPRQTVSPHLGALVALCCGQAVSPLFPHHYSDLWAPHLQRRTVFQWLFGALVEQGKSRHDL